MANRDHQTGAALASESSQHHEELAVFTADLAGYSELMFRDPQSGFLVLRATRTIIASHILKNSGKVLQTPGDFVFATFRQFSDAFDAAAGSQMNLMQHHQAHGELPPGHWKIGIAFGDVYSIGEDYFGNAINVSSRLQSLASPGEIMFTGPPASLTPPEGFLIRDVGAKKLKNIDAPVRVQRAWLPSYEEFIEKTGPRLKTPTQLLRRIVKPVLKLEPFRNIGGGAESEQFGVALAEEIQVILSHLANTLTATDPAAKSSISHDYLLSGTVRQVGSHARIIGRLMSASDGTTIWSERFDCDLESSFDVQDQISQEIVTALQLHLTEGAQIQLWRRGTKSGRAWELFQRAHDIERRFTREGHLKAKELYGEALKLDNNYLSAAVALGFCHLDDVRLGWSSDEAASIANAELQCAVARKLAAQHPDVFALQAFLCFFRKDWDAALTHIHSAVALAPHSPEVIGYMGALYDLMGDFESAIAAYSSALATSPHAPAWIPSNLGLSYIAIGNVHEAERIFREVILHHPVYVRAFIGLTVSLCRQGSMNDARATAREVLRLDPEFTALEWSKSKPFQDERLSLSFVADLREAGVP
ncbi:MAG: tetratricopeptide repeat protein [Rhizobiales bacterium]|nr:tetratricopeptide repeat protein [Hyphomicrobiales bacterium]